MNDMHRPPRLEDIAGRIRPRMASAALLWVILGIFALFVIWASVTRIDRVTRAQGRVIPSSQLQVVSNLEGGVVGAILVRAGDRVERGAPLIRLDATAAGADYGKGEVTAAALSARLARLTAEASGTAPVWPDGVEATAPGILAIERSLHAERQAELGAETAAAQARLDAAGRAVAEARVVAGSRDVASGSAAQQAGMIRPLVAKGIEPRMSQIQADAAASAAAGDAAAAHEALGRAAFGVAEARSMLLQARTDWRSKAAEELAQTRAELSAQTRALPAAADRMRRTTIASPVAGTVNRVLVATPGGSVSPGQPLVEIVPARDKLVIEAALRPNDIAFVAIGQKARVKITAYDYAIYGSIDGEVTGISPDAVVDQKDNTSRYMIRVAIDRAAIVDGQGRKLPVGAGMVAEVDLLGDKRTVMSYLLTPISRLGETAFREH